MSTSAWGASPEQTCGNLLPNQMLVSCPPWHSGQNNWLRLLNWRKFNVRLTGYKKVYHLHIINSYQKFRYYIFCSLTAFRPIGPIKNSVRVSLSFVMFLKFGYVIVTPDDRIPNILRLIGCKKWMNRSIIYDAIEILSDISVPHSTGLFNASGIFEPPSISGIGGPILKPFWLVVVISCSFCLVYH